MIDNSPSDSFQGQFLGTASNFGSYQITNLLLLSGWNQACQNKPQIFSKDHFWVLQAWMGQTGFDVCCESVHRTTYALLLISFPIKDNQRFAKCSESLVHLIEGRVIHYKYSHRDFPKRLSVLLDNEWEHWDTYNASGKYTSFSEMICSDFFSSYNQEPYLSLGFKCVFLSS